MIVIIERLCQFSLLGSRHKIELEVKEIYKRKHPRNMRERVQVDRKSLQTAIWVSGEWRAGGLGRKNLRLVKF